MVGWLSFLPREAEGGPSMRLAPAYMQVTSRHHCRAPRFAVLPGPVNHLIRGSCCAARDLSTIEKMIIVRSLLMD